MNPYYLIIAFAMALILFSLARKYNWEKTLIYNYIFVAIAVLGLAFFSYVLSVNFNYTFLMINILLTIGIIPKVITIIKLRNKKKN